MDGNAEDAGPTAGRLVVVFVIAVVFTISNQNNKDFSSAHWPAHRKWPRPTWRIISSFWHAVKFNQWKFFNLHQSHFILSPSSPPLTSPLTSPLSTRNERLPLRFLHRSVRVRRPLPPDLRRCELWSLVFGFRSLIPLLKRSPNLWPLSFIFMPSVMTSPTPRCSDFWCLNPLLCQPISFRFTDPDPDLWSLIYIWSLISNSLPFQTRSILLPVLLSIALTQAVWVGIYECKVTRNVGWSLIFVFWSFVFETSLPALSQKLKDTKVLSNKDDLITKIIKSDLWSLQFLQFADLLQRHEQHRWGHSEFDLWSLIFSPSIRSMISCLTCNFEVQYPQ